MLLKSQKNQFKFAILSKQNKGSARFNTIPFQHKWENEDILKADDLAGNLAVLRSRGAAVCSKGRLCNGIDWL